MNISLKPSTDFVRANLASHSVLGLTVGILLYVICVSGTLAIFYKELERWEQPTVPEIQQVAPDAINRAAQATLARAEEKPEHLFVSLPTEELPRLVVSTEESGYFADQNGTLLDKVEHDWTHFLVYLHFALNLPTTLGITIVGIIGIIMMALIISGLLAHPNIFRDAFALRMNKSPRLQQVDLHNRLSVWAAPFHLVIALTGAFIGLSSVLIFVVATLFYDGDTDAAGQPVGGVDPAPSGVSAPLMNVGDVVEKVRVDMPDERAFYLTVHEPATTAQVVDVGTQVPQRLAWAEVYRYNAAGEHESTRGWSKGEVGAQIYAATFRLHFGHFGGLPIKLAYVLLGLALCAVVASGINIWLEKRRQKGLPTKALASAWAATVWGVPFVITLSAFTYIALRIPAVPVFWFTTSALLLAAWLRGEPSHWRTGLQMATVVTGLAVVTAHTVRFGSAAWSSAGLFVNLIWLVLAGALGFWLWFNRQERRRERSLPKSGAEGLSAQQPEKA